MAEPQFALTLQRPWPHLVLRGGKDVENRPWKTNYRGPVVIHAGKTWGAYYDLRYGPQAQDTGLVGVVDLVDICGVKRPADQDCGCGSWKVAGLNHWRLAHPRPLPEPIPTRGRLGLWRLDDDLAARVAAQLAKEGSR